MDDFLHNLRSGKLKQPDRSNRHFNDPQYKGPQRRNPMERRKKEFDNKESTERLGAIKEVLETLAETQRRLLEAYAARNVIEERKARAIEVLAENLYGRLNPEVKGIDTLFTPTQPPLNLDADTAEAPPVEKPVVVDASDEFVENIDETAIVAESVTAYTPNDDAAADNAIAGSADTNIKKLTEHNRREIVELTGRLRAQGDSWENIARLINSQGFPTISGKGSWRGMMIKGLYEKMSVVE